MKKRKIFAAILCSALMLSAFSGCRSGKSSDSTIEIELSGNPTTGYTWVYSLSQEGIVEEVSGGYVAAEHENGFVGRGGTFLFEFKGAAPGDVTVDFSYLRTFQENSTVKTASYTIHVDKDLNASIVDSTGIVEVPNFNGSTVIAGEIFSYPVSIEGMSEDVDFVWTLCNAGFYIGVDKENVVWSCADGIDTFEPVYGNPEDAIRGTMMTAVRHTASEKTAEQLAAELASSVKGAETAPTSFNGYEAVCVTCADNSAAVDTIFIQIGGDVVEIAVSCEGENAEGIGARLYAMLETIVFAD